MKTQLIAFVIKALKEKQDEYLSVARRFAYESITDAPKAAAATRKLQEAEACIRAVRHVQAFEQQLSESNSPARMEEAFQRVLQQAAAESKEAAASQALAACDPQTSALTIADCRTAALDAYLDEQALGVASAGAKRWLQERMAGAGYQTA